MKVLGIGESVIDKAQLSDTTVITTHVGGPAPIALILLSRLGIDCTLLTTLGKDAEGKIIEDTLLKEKVNVLAKRQEKTKINTYLIGADGSRKKVRGEIIHQRITNIDERFLQQFDIIIIDRHEKKAFYEIVAKKKNETKIIIDPSTEVSQFTLDMIRYADYPILPMEALTKIDQGKDLTICLQKLYQISNKPFIVTAGDLGSILYNGTTIEIIPALQLQTIDVQGAGDIYRGGFAYGLLNKWNTAQSAKFATIVAGLQCTKLGNASAIPTKQEITDYQNLLMKKQLQTIQNYFFNNVKQYE